MEIPPYRILEQLCPSRKRGNLSTLLSSLFEAQRIDILQPVAFVGEKAKVRALWAIPQAAIAQKMLFASTIIQASESRKRLGFPSSKDERGNFARKIEPERLLVAK